MTSRRLNGAVLLVAPFVLVFAVFGVFPLLYTAWMSVRRWHLIDGDHGFVGLANYARLFADPDFYHALGNTVCILVVATAVQMVLSLWLAVLLDRATRGRALWCSVALLPNVVPAVAVALIFAQLFGRDYGVVNWLLKLVGAGPVNWQAHSWSAYLGVAAMVVWRWTGYNALLCLAAMQTVPRELVEAAQLDGASRWRVFRSVTLPLIRPTVSFTLLMSVVGGLQVFTEPQLFDVAGLSGTGGNDRQFQTVVMYLYEQGFGRWDAGYAATVSWSLFLLCAAFGVVNAFVFRRPRSGAGP
nr:sugar ABC transporter permease [Actinokineospora enzanensis]